jgi:predicted choloylglycine hydrolase
LTIHSLTFDAVAEPVAGPLWADRWRRSWPAYEAWFRARGGDAGPDRAACAAALARHMPELVPVYRRLTRLAGGGDRAARFLSTWCPPRYLGGCSIAALAAEGAVRLVRNYDLAPELNEGLLLRSEWTGRPVMGMVEFLWGLSDGVNAGGLAAALAYGGRSEVGPGFGAPTILRYLLETCSSVAEAVVVLNRVPSHMPYNITLADRHGATATVELLPGGGARVVRPSVATNHQHGAETADNPGFTRTSERRDLLHQLVERGVSLEALTDAFLREPLFQRNYGAGFGTLFTAIYDPMAGGLTLRWQSQGWTQSLGVFAPGTRTIRYGEAEPAPPLAPGLELDEMLAAIRPHLSGQGASLLDRWAAETRIGRVGWVRFGHAFVPAARYGPGRKSASRRPILRK